MLPTETLLILMRHAAETQNTVSRAALPCGSVEDAPRTLGDDRGAPALPDITDLPRMLHTTGPTRRTLQPAVPENR